jgi:glycosyltransferase involved in cell wall biosynthesis
MSNKIKILILSHSSEFSGGAEMSLINVLDYWNQRYKMNLFFIIRKPVGTLVDELNKRGWQYNAIEYGFWSEANPSSETGKLYKNALMNIRAIKDIQKIIKSYKPDFVITNSIVCPWAAFASFQLGVPHVWFVREYGDLDHGRIFELGREKTFQDVDLTSFLIVANSKTLAEHIKLYCDSKKVTTLYTPFDVKSLQKNALKVVKSPFKYENSLKVVITGNLAPTKGQLEAIQSVIGLNKKGYQTELCILGGKATTEFMNKINQLIEDGEVKDKIHLMGFQENPMAFVRLADVGIMASRMEAFGRVTFEYIALGKPVVGSNSGATPEMVKNGINGFLYDAQSKESLTEALMHYAINRGLITKHGKASKQVSHSLLNGNFNADKLMERIMGELWHTRLHIAKPLNYTQRLYDFIEYAHTADTHIGEPVGKTSIKRIMAKKARNKLRTKVSLLKKLTKRSLK